MLNSVFGQPPKPNQPPNQPPPLADRLRAEGVEALATAARERGDAVRGAILFAQQSLGCAACHSVGAKDLLGPDLTRLPKPLTDLKVVESMLNPSRQIDPAYKLTNFQLANGKRVSGRVLSKNRQAIVIRNTSPQRKRMRLAVDDIEKFEESTKSAMPDDLANLLKDRQQFLDLARYAMTLTATRSDLPPPPPVQQAEASIDPSIRGLALMDALRCRACHTEPKAMSQTLSVRGPNLQWISGRISPTHIQKFITDPQSVKPGGRMPDVLASLSNDERRKAVVELTHYVASLGREDDTIRQFERRSIPPTNNSASTETAGPTQGDSASRVSRGGELFHSVGCVACHSPRDERGSETMLDSSIPLGDAAGKYAPNALVEFLEDPHRARPSGLMPQMQLTHWEAVDVASYLLNSTKTPLVAESFQVDTELAKLGELRFKKVGCAECHAMGNKTAPRKYPPLAKTQDRGCLSGTSGPHPKYTLTDAQKSDLLAAIAREESLSESESIQHAMISMRCDACHQRDGLGGFDPSRDEFFQTENPNLGPQGRIPPTLTGVGAKLKPKWMRQVLVSGRSIRPYMKTRMPQFGAENTGYLVDLFQHVDGIHFNHASFTPPKFKDAKEMRDAGHRLAGSDGLNCVACHTYQLKPAATMPAVDITEMAERIHPSWFHRYMKSPQSLSPNTVMPSFWLGGRAIRADVLNGDPDLQIEALWQYLLDGRQGRQPRGVVVEPMELVATNEAVMLRRSYPGIGKRGIGVGYPSQINLAYDAEQMRVAMLWRGKFADPSGVWRGQGHGTVRPLAREVIRLEVGPDLDDSVKPWEVDDGRPPEHRFLGYRLDEKRRPTFRYQFQNVLVTDYWLDVPESEAGPAHFVRTVKLRSPTARPGLRFRIATGKAIQSISQQQLVIDQRLSVEVIGRGEPKIASHAEQRHVDVPVSLLAEEEFVLTLKYSWK